MELSMFTDGAESKMDTCPIVNDIIETSIRKLASGSDSAADHQRPLLAPKARVNSCHFIFTML